jgi:hypothetical protein
VNTQDRPTLPGGECAPDRDDEPEGFLGVSLEF